MKDYFQCWMHIRKPHIQVSPRVLRVYSQTAAGTERPQIRRREHNTSSVKGKRDDQRFSNQGQQ